MLKTTLRDFAIKELEPIAAELDKTGEFPAKQVKQIADLGLMGLTISEQYGGSGKGHVDFCIAVEELARACPAATGYFRVSLSLAVPPIAMYGNHEQKLKYLVPQAKGDKLTCFALTEPGAGSDPASMETTAKKVKGGYVINGTKIFISCGAEAEIEKEEE